jgi:hypothetical protein
MNPYRMEGELVGEESHDMDGNLIEDWSIAIAM